MCMNRPEQTSKPRDESGSGGRWRERGGMWKLPATREEVSFWYDETALELENCYDDITR